MQIQVLIYNSLELSYLMIWLYLTDMWGIDYEVWKKGIRILSLNKYNIHTILLFKQPKSSDILKRQE